MENTKTTWYVVNAVWYDGCEAFVSKFIVQVDIVDSELGITEESKQKLMAYLNGNGELLKVDMLYPVDLDNILAMRDNSDSPEYQAAFERFKNMWF